MTIRDLLARPRFRARCGGPHVAPTAAGLAYNRLCHLEDFAHPALRPVLRSVFAHEIARFGPDYPAGREYRKHWEVAMAARTLADLGVLHDRAEVLGVGAGSEPTIFWLTSRVRRVFATDLYLQDGSWSGSAHASMLADPARYWPAGWNPRRLVVQHMDGLDLRYEDDSFDAIFSSSSIEHFGGPVEVRRALAEMARVLKPGGVLSISTEFRLEGPPPGLPGALLFDAYELRSVFLDGLPWEPIGPIDLSLSEATRRAEIPFAEAAEEVRRHVEQCGVLTFHRLDWGRYPHIVLRHDEHAWTSVHLALRKRSES